MNERPNPIDAVISAGRLYAANLPVLLPVIIVLQAIKCAVLIGLVSALGDDAGGTLGWITSSIMLVLVDAVAARFVVDAHHGAAPRSPVQLVTRLVPILPQLMLFGLVAMVGMIVLSSLFQLRVYTQIAAFPGTAVFVVWLDAQRTKEDPAQRVDVAADTAFQLAQLAAWPAAALFVFQLFSLELIPALTDSTIGRKAPLAQWSPVEGVISTLVTPIVIIAIASLFLQLRGWAAQAPSQPPAAPWPQMPGAPPTA